jgi:hypothetical protein
MGHFQTSPAAVSGAKSKYQSVISGMLFHFCFDFARFLMITLVLRPPNKTVERTRIRVGCVPRQSARADQHGREVAGT